MRVAFFVGGFPCASETFVVNAARAVTGAGHDLTIFALDPVLETHDEAVRADIADLLPLVRRADPPVRLAQKPRHVARALADLSRHGRRAAYLLSPPRPEAARLAARALFDAEAVSDGRFDILHCHFATLGVRAARLRAAGVVSGRLILHCRGHDVGGELPLMPATARATFAAADGIIANSEHFRRKAIALGAREADSTVIPSGLDTDAFVFAERRPPTDRPVRILTVGRLVEKKGIAYLLEALARLDAPVTLDVLGDGVLREALEEQASALGLQGRVRFHGQVAHAQVRDAIGEADLFAAPSVTAANGDQDAGTNTLKEAMASGLPVIATRHGGIPELVRDGTDGILVPERDVGALTDAIGGLVAAPERWAAMGRAGRARVEAGFSQEASAAKLIAAYETVIAGGRLSALPR